MHIYCTCYTKITGLLSQLTSSEISKSVMFILFGLLPVPYFSLLLSLPILGIFFFFFRMNILTASSSFAKSIYSLHPSLLFSYCCFSQLVRLYMSYSIHIVLQLYNNTVDHRPLSKLTVSYTHLRAPRDKRQSRMPSSA